MSQLDTADRRTVAGEEPSETVLLTKTRLKEKLAKLEEEVFEAASKILEFLRIFLGCE